MKKTSIALTFFLAWLLAGPMAWAQKDETKEHAELAKALKDAKVSLQKGLTASAREGSSPAAGTGHGPSVQNEAGGRRGRSARGAARKASTRPGGRRSPRSYSRRLQRRRGTAASSDRTERRS